MIVSAHAIYMIELGYGSACSSAPAEAFVARWVDHATWPEWSPDTEWVRVDGPVREGARGQLKPKGGPKVRFEITAYDASRRYTDTSRLPGARLVFEHTAEPTATGTNLHVHVAISGPLARAWALTLGRGFRVSAQADLDRLVQIVESGP